MKILFRLSLLVFLTGCLWRADAARAELTIDISKGAEGALPIAVVPFAGNSPFDLAQIVSEDLERTGKFAPLSRGSMPSMPHDLADIRYDDWKKLAMENLVVGNVQPGPGGGYQVDFRLVDVYKNAQLVGFRIPSGAGGLRQVAHQISDIIYKTLMGQPGAFATKIAYITVSGYGANKTYKLQVADSDGFGEQTLVTSHQPIMSPAWAPDGRRLAYVSFERGNSAIYVQDVATGSRQEVVSGDGINSAPAWSPDGNKLAMTLSRDGNPEIYVMHMGSHSLQRITADPGIDTEPAWSPDGSQIAFTSDRGGGAQIYLTSASGGGARRVTHSGSYNARPSFSGDGKKIAMVHRQGGQDRIAVLDLGSEKLNVLSSTHLDESPSFAPNSSMIIYATGSGLVATSVDGQGKYRLGLSGGQVREPTWGPIRNN